MNKEWKTKWLEALRSGEYEQTTGELIVETNYCCLGVLCQLVDPNNTYNWQGEQVLPQEVVYVTDLHDDNPTVKVSQTDMLTQQTTLAHLNDNGSTFDQIADLIEEQL